jgi:cytoskeletal protein CcmA (bactofilin family)
MFDETIKVDRINVDGPLFLRGSSFSREIRLVGATINGALDCRGATLKVSAGNALSADRAEIGGLLNLGQGVDLNGNSQIFSSSGTIRLSGAKIKGDLSCAGAKFTVTAGDALYADNAEIGGNVWLNNLESTGTIRLPYAQIKGVLSCSGAKLRVKEGDALYAEGVEIRGSVYLNASLNKDSNQREDFESTGTIRMPGAQIKGVLSCSGAKLNGPVLDALFADCVIVGANVNLDKGFESSGAIRLLGALIDGELGFIGAKTARVICKDMHLRGDMWWTGVQKSQETNLDLTGASMNSLHDDRESWPSPEHITLDGLAYKELVLHKRPTVVQVMSNAHGSELPFKAEERIEWLMLQDPEHCSKAGSWMQLRDLLERKGDRKGAKRVLYKLRCLQAEKEWFLRRSWTIAFAWLEEAPSRIWRSIAFVLLLGSIVFGYAGSHGAIAPTESEAYKAFIAGSPLPSAYPSLNPFVYTLDNAVPLVKLGQDEKWAPDRRYPGTKWFTNYWFLMWTRWVLILSGWFQAGVLGAALLRRFKE